MIEKLKKINEKITGIGSLPFEDLKEGIDFVLENFKEIPFIPQFPKLNFREDMNIQIIENMPGIKLKEKKIIFDGSEEEIIYSYQKIEENDIEYFKIGRDFGIGLHKLLNIEFKGIFLKGQVSGPITFLSNAKDLEGKPLIYNEIFEDIFIKFIALKGIWLSKKIKEKGKIPIIFFDEPVMASFGSAFFPLEKERIINVYNELINFFRDKEKDCLIGIHCCGNTDWSIFLNLDIDILSFDTFNYVEKFLLYWNDIEKYIKRGKIISWGIIPSSDEILNIDFQQIKELLNKILSFLERKGYKIDEIKNFSIFTPSCGLGYIQKDSAYKVVEYLKEIVKF